MDTDPLKLSDVKPLRNRSGRPKKGDIIQFGPQPQSQISKLLQSHRELLMIKSESSSQDFAISDNEENCLQDNSTPTYRVNEIELDTKTEVKGKQYRCKFLNCNYSCKLSCNLIKHKRVHSQEKPYLCDMCSFQSKFVNSLKAHRRIHTNERPFKCSFCSYCCNSSSNLKKHCKHRHT